MRAMILAGTYSIVGHCTRTGMLGVVAGSTAVMMGSRVPYTKAGVGAIACQALINPYLGAAGVSLLEEGLSVEQALQRLVEGDNGRDLRQFAIVDSVGRAAAHTGKQCLPWAGHLLREGYACLGNAVEGQHVLQSMARSFKENHEAELPDRLLACLEAGQQAAVVKGATRSACVRIVRLSPCDRIAGLPIDWLGH